MMAVLFVVCVALFGAWVSGDVSCNLRQGGQVWKADPRDCSKFYLCFNGQKFNFTCGENVWDPTTRTCVGAGSEWDKCSIKSQLENLNPCSSRNVERAAKGDNCAQYYDCVSRDSTLTSDPLVKECPYPMLYNDETNRCEPYALVTCGQRKEAKDPCEYESNQCQRSHCIPCHVRYPSCNGLQDGMNSWVGREWSPFFVVCEQGRVVYKGQCDETNAQELFNPEKRACEVVKDERDLKELM
ncbi:uncharacterized protein LOC124146560 [Haliotis rufescens]|uniref:uncharacterized protein LOC124146560 n=1 Tax=Haliotis rufescens TaxID=6454 RepID=UPI00201F314A|nr:uncharacterized protein LOC124146560 [Haliotis rufescens]